MKRTYTCPSCKGVLNPEGAIILRATDEGRQMLLGLHPEPGNYEMYIPDGSELPPGSIWSMSCPVCGVELQLGANGELCMLHMDEGGETKQVWFSPRKGQRLTFVVNTSGEVERFGDSEQIPEELPFDWKL
jgi:Zn-finger nucleic acid-binding protein